MIGQPGESSGVPIGTSAAGILFKNSSWNPKCFQERVAREIRYTDSTVAFLWSFFLPFEALTAFGRLTGFEDFCSSLF